MSSAPLMGGPDADQKVLYGGGNEPFISFQRLYEIYTGENLDLVYGQPFSSSLEAQAEYAGIGLAIDYKGLEMELEAENDSRGLQVLRYQLAKYKKIIPDLYIHDKE